MFWVQIVLGIAGFYTYYYLRRLLIMKGGRPPGPIPIPGLGNLHQILLADKEKPFVAFQKMAKTYGNIFSVQLGVVNAVSVNGYDAMKELLTNDDMTGRKHEAWWLDRTFGKPIGLGASVHNFWKETRRFSTRTMKDHGFGNKDFIELHTIEEFKEFIKNLKVKAANGPVHMENIFSIPFLNVVWTSITGVRFSEDDARLRGLLESMDDFMKNAKHGGGLLSAYPFLKEWAPDLSGYTAMHNANVAMQTFLKELLATVRQKGDYLDNPQSFVERFLQRIDRPDVEDKPTPDLIFTDENLISIIYDLFVGGSDTTSHTLNFAIRYLIQNPNIQQKIRKEIVQVVGTDRWPSLADKPKMEFTNAVILEVLRITNVAPITMRMALKDSTLGHYSIPKGTLIIANPYSANMEECYWGDPHVFKPERFMSENAEAQAERLISFSLGKRNCFGERVAKATLFLGLCSLLQKFTFEQSEIQPGSEIVVGLTLSPAPFSAIIKPR